MWEGRLTGEILYVGGKSVIEKLLYVGRKTATALGS